MKTLEKEITNAHLKKMNLSSTSDINNWYVQSRTEGFKIKGLNKIAELIPSFKNRYIYIFADYDVDGTMAATVLYLSLKRFGCQNVKYRIPHRFSEGFGVNEAMLDEISEKPEDVLIITVDNGVAAIETISKAKSRGFTVVVTDHHQPVVIDGKVVLPNADIIVDPNAIPNSANFNGYCGAGLAYKIAEELSTESNLQKIMPDLDKNERSAVRGFVRRLLPLVSMATVCDQMELTEENYVFVREGLKMINKGEALPGILILGETLGISHWTEDKFGFNAGPCVNALERMEDGASKLAVALMTSGNRERCVSIAEFMRKYNENRKIAVEYGYQKAIEAIKSRGDDPGYPIIEYIPRLGDPSLNKLEGYIGNIVGRITEQTNCPCALFTDSSDGILKGSFRSVEGYDVKKHLDMCQQEFVTYGGHAMAAGASVEKANFEHMRNAMQSCSERPTKPLNVEKQGFDYDVVIKDSEIKEAIEHDQRFAPFGNGNEPLIYKIEGFNVIFDKGEIKKPIKGGGVRFKSIYCTAVGFGLWDLASDIVGPCSLTLYGKISYNYFNGNATPQVELIRFEKEQPTISKTTVLQQMLADAAKRK